MSDRFIIIIVIALAVLMLADAVYIVETKNTLPTDTTYIYHGKPWQQVCIESGVDTNTVGTTTDPDDSELTHNN